MKPIKPIIHISYYFHELLPTGDVGKSLTPALNRELGINNKILKLKVTGQEAIDKIKEFDNELRKLVEKYESYNL